MNLVVLAFDFPRRLRCLSFSFCRGGYGVRVVVGAEARGSPVRCREAQSIPTLGQRKLLLDFFHQPGVGYAGSSDCGPIRLLGSTGQRTTAPPGAVGRSGSVFPPPGAEWTRRSQTSSSLSCFNRDALSCTSAANGVAVVLENVPFIKRKEKALTRLLGTLQVDVRPEGGTGRVVRGKVLVLELAVKPEV